MVVHGADTGCRFGGDADGLPFCFGAGNAPKGYHAVIDSDVQQICKRPRLRLQVCEQFIANG